MFFILYCNNIHVNGLLLNFVLGELNSVDQIYIDKYSIDDVYLFLVNRMHAS
jgi:hypothetical protein